MIYVVQDRFTLGVIHMNDSISKVEPAPGEVYPQFDPKTMKIGRTDKKSLPQHFRIDENGEVVELTPEEHLKEEELAMIGPYHKMVDGEVVKKTPDELIKDGIENLEDYKRQAIERVSAEAFGKRRELIPDFKLGNAALEIYDPQRTADYKATVCAFRDEYHRLKNLVNKATTVEQIQAIAVNFPKEIVKVASKNKVDDELA